MSKIIEINTKKIIDALSENKKMPYFLNEENEMIFNESMKEFYSYLQEEHPDCLVYQGNKITESTWNDTKIIGSLFTSLFSHWNKILNQSSIFFLEILEDFPENLELEVEGEAEPFILFYKASDGMISKRDECIYESDEDTIFDFFDWLEHEVITEGNIDKVAKKYQALMEVFVNGAIDDKLDSATEEQDSLQIELSDDFYDNIEELRKSILIALEDNLEIDPNSSQMNLSKDKNNLKEFKIEPLTIKFNWLGKETTLSYPFNLTEDLINLNFDYSILDNKNGWLALEEHNIRETIVALWSDFIYNKHKDIKKINESEETLYLNWDSFSEYLLYWLRFESGSDVKKIDKKIKSTYDKIVANGKVSDFNYIENPSDFIKCVLYIEKMSAIEKNKGIIFDVENIQKQYFYALNNDHVISNIWAFLIQDRIKKTKVTKTFEYQFESLKEKFPNFKEVIDYYSGAMYIFEQTGTPPAPVLLLGSPGLGKTHFASEISKIIGSMMTVIPISSLTAGWIISGAASQWKDAQMGKLAQALLNGNSMSPVIVLDEIDKKSEGNYDPLGSLYPLLEYQTAKEFVDEFLEFPLDSSKVLWVATANNLNSISEPILDRFVVFDIAKLNSSDTIKVANNIFHELTNGLNHQELSEDILDILKDKTPRQIKQVLKKALAYAAVKRSQEIVLQKEHLDLKTKIKKIGF